MAHPASATNDKDEDEVEFANDAQISDKEGKAGDQSPEKRTTQAAGQKSHGERADKSKGENSDKNLKSSTKESKVNEAKTDPTGKNNRESSSEKKATPASGSETAPTKRFDFIACIVHMQYQKNLWRKCKFLKPNITGSFFWVVFPN